MAPGDQTDAVLRIVRFPAKRGDCFGRFQYRLEKDSHRNSPRCIQGVGNLARVIGDNLQSLRSVKVLAAGDEPNFKLLQIQFQRLNLLAHGGYSAKN